MAKHTKHQIDIENTQVVSKKSFYYPKIIIEAIEIKKQAPY